MNIIHAGIPRSGNVWLHTILVYLIEESNDLLQTSISREPIYDIAKHWNLGFEKQASIDWVDVNRLDVRERISSVYRRPIIDWEAYLKKASVVSTHSYVNKITKSFFRNFNLAVYLIRDPRDILISRSRYDFSEYMKQYYPNPFSDPQEYIEMRLEEIVGRWVCHVAGYLYNQSELGLYLIFYEDLLRNPYGEILKLAKALGMELSEQSASKIVDNTNIEKMKKRGFSGHVWRGEIGSWKEYLDNDQKKRAIYVGGKIMRNLGYCSDDISRMQVMDWSFGSNDGTSLLREELTRSKMYVDSDKTYDESIPSYM